MLPPEELLEFAGELLDPLEVSDEVWACAVITRHAAQNAIAAINCFFIILPFVVFVSEEKKRHHPEPFYTFANLVSPSGTLNGDRTQFSG